MKRLSYYCILLTLIIPLFSSVAQAASAVNGAINGVLITQLQTGTTASASEEFIELYNASPNSVDVSTWRLEYFSSSTSNFDNPARKIPLHGIIGSHNYFLASSLNYLADETNEAFSATLAKSGGHIRLVSQLSESSPAIVQDLVGWGSAQHPEGSTAIAPTESKSILRKTDQTGNFIDSDNNSNDFAINDTPTPRSDPVLTPTTEEPEPIPNPLPPIAEIPIISDILPDPILDTPQDPQPESTLPNLAPARLSEILPNPAAPASDDTDEFIELYNPNPEALPLAGYKLQSGNTFSYSYTFSTESIPGQTYQAFMVTQTGDTLANAGGKVRLIDASGNVVDETAYGAASDGQAWIRLNDTWQWTTTPSPNAPNILMANGSAAKAATTKKPAAAKPKAVKAASTTKPKAAAKTSTSKAAKKSTGSDKDEKPTTSMIHPIILAVITLIAVGYALYEYRDDIANRIHQLRRDRTNRRVARQEQ